MEISFYQNEKHWDEFLLANNGSFLQCFAWAKIQEASGKKVFLLCAGEGSEAIMQALVIKEPLPFGRGFFYIPFGPCFAKEATQAQQVEALNLLIKTLKQQAKTEKCIFFHIEPISELPEVRPRAIKNIQPKETWLFDLAKDGIPISLSEIEAGFTQKVRYNIKLAERKGVKVNVSSQYNGHFFELLKQTSKRAEFRHFQASHYNNIFSQQNEHFKARMFLAELNSKIISAHIVVIFNRAAYFLHAANDLKYKEYKAVNLLQWEKIKYAKEQGCVLCDFWGYDEKRWPGFSAFKKSFGGYKHTYPERYTIPLNKPLFFLYHFLRRLKNAL